MENHLADLARRSPNFRRLFEVSKLLAFYGAQAEVMIYDHPNMAITQAGKFGETLAEELVMRLGIKVKTRNQVDRIRALSSHGAVTKEIERDFHLIRAERNDAVHNHVFESNRALIAVQTSHKLGLWFFDAVTNNRTIDAFIPPPPPEPVNETGSTSPELQKTLDNLTAAVTRAEMRLHDSADRLDAEHAARRRTENLVDSALQFQNDTRERLAEIGEQVSRLSKNHERAYQQFQSKKTKPDTITRDRIIYRLRRRRPRTEVETREEIDQLLEAANWVVQDFSELDVTAGVGVAVREFPLANGRADYVLYVNKRIVGVIEAKREGESLSAAAAQNDRYAKGVRRDYSLALWRKDEPFLFRYASTGTETWFINRLDPDARSRPVFAFHQPETISRWIREADENPDAPTFRAALRKLPKLEEGGFRPAQIEAIHGLEASLAQDRPRALVQMATGAGKTYMGAAQTYRLLKHARANRVLFLVDRNNLGRQTEAEFNYYIAPDDGRRLEDLYNVDRLGPAGLQSTSSVVICTIQRMYSLLRGEQIADDLETDEVEDNKERDRPAEVGYNPHVPIEAFDLIIVDECHRSIYGLWRSVLEYFDSHIVGLTATPTQQTFGFFARNLVSEYTYPQSVADGVNVDFDILRIETNIREKKLVVIDAGETVEVRDRLTRHTRYEQLDDDFSYSTEQIGRNVETVDEIRQVLAHYRDNWRHWFSGRSEMPKTLIFAVSDAHAESILAQVKEVFSRGDDFAKKITYKTRQAGEDPNQLIRDFRTSPSLRVAVTVDMIATGTDVRALECVIFMRDVGSPVLFEQMKGRGARTIDPTELQEVTPGADRNLTKSSFLLIDPVGVTDHPLHDAKPLAPASSKQVSLKKLLDKTAAGSINLHEAETLAGRLARLDQQIGDKDRELLERASNGGSLSKIAHDIVNAADPDAQDKVKAKVRERGGDEKEADRAARDLLLWAIEPLASKPDFRQEILDIRREKDYVIDSSTQVEIVRTEKKTAEERSLEAIQSWHDYIEANRDRINAIEIALNHRGDLTPSEVYAELEALATMISRPQRAWTPKYLWDCYERLGKATEHPSGDAGIPDLICLIRYELGVDQQLKPYREVVLGRFQGWLLRQKQAGTTFSDEQMWWLERIRDVVATDTGIEAKLMKEEPFRERGGGRGFKRAFPDRNALEFLQELNRELA